MWIKRSDWALINECVEKLEDAQCRSAEPMYRDPFAGTYGLEIPMSDAIRIILNHFGLRIAKRECKTEYVIEKVKKAA